jgi:hypothetical protein
MHLSPLRSGLFSFFSYSIHGRQETLTFGRYGVGESLPAAIGCLTRFRFVHEWGWISRYAPRRSHCGHAVDFDIEAAGPRRYVDKNPCRGLRTEKARIDLVDYRKLLDRRAVHIALEHLIQ